MDKFEKALVELDIINIGLWLYENGYFGTNNKKLMIQWILAFIFT
jgi:hypothetical protein